MTAGQGISTICLIKFGVLMLTQLSGHPLRDTQSQSLNRTVIVFCV